MNILIIEDTEERIVKFKQKLIGHHVDIAKTAKDGIDFLKNNKLYSYILLDHDLSGQFESPGIGTGYEVCEWITNNPEKKPTRILIHSANNVGAAAMMRRFGDFNMRATYIPFLWDKLEIKES